MSDITVILPEGEAKLFGGDASVADALAELLSNKQRKAIPWLICLQVLAAWARRKWSCVPF